MYNGCMKYSTQARFYQWIASLLAIASGLLFFNNIVIVVRWWHLFLACGGDATVLPDTVSGLSPFLDWAAVDYSCATTLIPFLGFYWMARGLSLALRGRHQDPEQFPFFKGYDQFNIALGLVGTLWGIILIGYFQMDTVSMGDLMTCLHTALFSTLMAVVWVFWIDHAMIRPKLAKLLQSLQGTEIEDQDILDLIGQLTTGARGLQAVWEGHRERLLALNDVVVQVQGEFLGLSGIGKQVGEVLTQEVVVKTQQSLEHLSVLCETLETQQQRMTKVFEERLHRLEGVQAEAGVNVQALAGLLGQVQQTQGSFASLTEKLAQAHGELRTQYNAARREGDVFRAQVATLEGEKAGQQKQIERLMEQMRQADAQFTKRLEAITHERDELIQDRLILEGEKARALEAVEQTEKRAEKAEALVEKIKSAFQP